MRAEGYTPRHFFLAFISRSLCQSLDRFLLENIASHAWKSRSLFSSIFHFFRVQTYHYSSLEICKDKVLQKVDNIAFTEFMRIPRITVNVNWAILVEQWIGM